METRRPESGCRARWRREMIKVCALAALAAMLPGCVRPASSWKGTVKWPETEQDEQSVKTLIPATEAGAALAAAAAIREMVRTNPFPGLFEGCSSPEQGLDFAVFTGPTPGLYYVVLGQRFDRCGGSSGRVLDGYYAYAVTPQGEVVEEAPPLRGELPTARPQSAPPSDQTPPPAAASPDTGTGTPAQVPPPASSPAVAPASPPAVVPTPASPPPPPPPAAPK